MNSLIQFFPSRLYTNPLGMMCLTSDTHASEELRCRMKSCPDSLMLERPIDYRQYTVSDLTSLCKKHVKQLRLDNNQT